METFFASGILWRLPLYIATGIVAEVLFTGLTDLIQPRFLQSWKAKIGKEFSPPIVHRDPRAMGYTFLWMIPIYMLLIFIEPISQILAEWHWIFRGLIYLLIIWIAEFCGGWIIKKITGLIPWDYSYHPLSFQGLIRWDFAPFWFVFGLFIEWFSQKLILLTPAIQSVF